MAAVELAVLARKFSWSVIEKIKDYLLSVDGMSTQVTTILYAVSAMGVDGVAVYRALTEHTSSKIRSIAWQRYISTSNGWDQVSLWMPALKDRDKGVQRSLIPWGKNNQVF